MIDFGGLTDNLCSQSYLFSLPHQKSELFIDSDWNKGTFESNISNLPFVTYSSNPTPMLIHNNKLYLIMRGSLSVIEKTFTRYSYKKIFENHIQLDSSGNIYPMGDPRAYFGDGSLDKAAFNDILDIDFDDQENIYLDDSSNHLIRKIDNKTGYVSTFAGFNQLKSQPIFSELIGGFQDGDLQKSLFNQPYLLKVFGRDELIVCDLNKALRYLFQGQVRTLILSNYSACMKS